MKNLIQIWSRIISFDCTWVLFAHGTSVVVPAGSEDPRQTARDILRDLGEVSGTGTVIGLAQLPGWVVTASHPDVLTYVGPADVGAAASNLTIAYYASAALVADAGELRVVHVERSRSQAFARSASPDGSLRKAG